MLSAPSSSSSSFDAAASSAVKSGLTKNVRDRLGKFVLFFIISYSQARVQHVFSTNARLTAKEVSFNKADI